MFQTRIYATFILIAGVIVPVVALPMPSPPQAGSSKDGSHPIANPPSPNAPHSDFFFNIEGINTDGGHDVRYDQHHGTSSIYSDVHMEAPSFRVPTTEQAAGPQSPPHHGQTLPPTDNTGSPPRISYSEKGKRKADSDAGRGSPPASKKPNVANSPTPGPSVTADVGNDKVFETSSISTKQPPGSTQVELIESQAPRDKPLLKLEGKECPECGMTFTRHHAAQRHINVMKDAAHVNSPYRQNLGEEFACTWSGCNKKFKRMETFKKHVENLDLHHRDKFINIYNEGPSSPQHSASSSHSNSPTPEPSMPNKKGKASTSQFARAKNIRKAEEAAKAAKIRSGVQAGPSKSKK